MSPPSPPGSKPRRVSARLRAASIGLASIGLIVSVLLTGGGAWAAHDAAADDGSLHALFLRALERDPAQQALAARLAAADAGHDVADSLFPQPPRVQAYNLTDKPARDHGWQEAEVQVLLPIWLPGESSAVARKADAEHKVAVSSAQRSALTLAGTLRAAVWDLALARRLERLAEDRLTLAAALENDVAREVARGAASRLDLGLAQGERADAAATLEARRGATAAARETLAALTDATDIAPDPAAEEAVEATAPDPRLGAAQAAETLAQESASLSRIADREHPEVGMIYRHNRDTFSGPPSDYVGLQVTIPFSGPGYTARTRSAEADLRQATAERASVERTLGIGVRQAQAALAHVRAQLLADRQRQSVAVDRAERMQRAFQLGEANATELIRARQARNDADATLAETEIKVRRAQSELLQAQGVLP